MIRKQLITLIFISIYCSRIFGTTHNTITDGGSGYGGTWDNTNEQFTRSDSKGLKLTWDADEVFIEVSGNNEHFIYFSGSSGTTSGKPWDITPTLPFDAQYCIVLYPWDGGLNNGYSWNGSDWNTGFTVDYIAHHNSDKSKTVKINTSTLGSQSSIKWCAFAKTSGSGSWVGGYVPNDASTSGDPSSTASEVLTKYYEYNSSVWLENSMNPNASHYSRPVELTISGNSGFRMMSSPVAGTIYSDLLNELWIQGMTNGDITGGTANVWTLSGQSWSALSNLNTASLTAGQGFLVYVYADT
ncbi:MAG: hypothetical protein HOD18_00115, partial [Candidatus Marinimicrobia bacterium]|nr:hypothetical protein [Candidatus Neomarinimicrobiota bacterium]